MERGLSITGARRLGLAGWGMAGDEGCASGEDAGTCCESESSDDVESCGGNGLAGMVGGLLTSSQFGFFKRNALL